MLSIHSHSHHAGSPLNPQSNTYIPHTTMSSATTPANPESRQSLWQDYYDGCGYLPREDSGSDSASASASASASKPEAETPSASLGQHRGRSGTAQGHHKGEALLQSSSLKDGTRRPKKDGLLSVYKRASSMPNKCRDETVTGRNPTEHYRDRVEPRFPNATSPCKAADFSDNTFPCKAADFSENTFPCKAADSSDTTSPCKAASSADATSPSNHGSSSDATFPCSTANCQKWSQLLRHALSEEDLGGFSLPSTPCRDAPAPNKPAPNTPLSGASLVMQSDPVLSVHRRTGYPLEGFEGTHLLPLSRFRGYAQTSPVIEKGAGQRKLPVAPMLPGLIPHSEPALSGRGVRTKRPTCNKELPKETSKMKNKGKGIQGKKKLKESNSLAQETGDGVVLSCLGVVPLGLSFKRGKSQ